jgi:hypothetical protein
MGSPEPAMKIQNLTKYQDFGFEEHGESTSSRIWKKWLSVEASRMDL